MGVFAQLLVNGLIAGSIYALVAIGFTMMYSVSRFMNIAHGATITVSAFILYCFYGILGWGLAISSVLAVAFAALFGLATNIALFKPLRKKKASNAVLLIASITLFTFMQSLMTTIFGADIKNLRQGTVSQGMEIMGASVTSLQIIIIFSALILLVFVWILMKKTKLGKAIRAVSDNKEVAETVGINSEKINNYTFMIASAIAGIAAVLIALERNVEPTMGFLVIIKAFVGSIMGGIFSVPGAVLGSYLLGIVENFGIWFIPSGYKDGIAFVLLVIFLLFRPQGIFGVNKGVRK